MRVTKAQAGVLRALAEGYSLKSHRYLDGTKIHRLHPLAGLPVPVERPIVDWLVKNGLVTSNQKFPAATYTLTDKGRALAASFGRSPEQNSFK